MWVRHARVCIEREQWWQAEYAIAYLRHCTMALACLRLDLPASYAKGADRLPAEIRATFEHAIARSVERPELVRALNLSIEALIDECRAAGDDDHVLQRLREMAE